MKLGSLFSGGGLGDFGFMAAGMNIAWQCEIDDYCQKILALRYPESRKYRDIKQLKGCDLERVDIITGGFPCQPFSNAGKRMGEQDDRHLWPEMLRIIQKVNPSWVVGENVLGLVNLGLDSVLADLESSGYSAITFVFPAHALGAWHRRERIWIVAHSGHDGWSSKSKQQQKEWPKEFDSSCQRDVADSTNPRAKGMRERQESTDKTMGNSGLLGSTEYEKQATRIKQSGEDVSDTGCKYGTWNSRELEASKSKWSFSNISLESGCERFRRSWQTEPPVGRVANGIADRVHRLKMLGNGQVPACTYVIGKMIMEIERDENGGN